ncbi:hypothetical protein IFM89_009800 [Coptis chinensis]|uniref:Uncharacterized protein n=1 Tax=Coptis chinensis TaxID=261450 RepID=A0A835I0T2_9MAGN|nr:hypothetical protein IFM89_009800 [Coptis chinensis]
MDEKKMKVKKGWLAVRVGLEDEDGGFQRFVIPIFYLYHPLFKRLLEKAKEIYGYHTTVILWRLLFNLILVLLYNRKMNKERQVAGWPDWAGPCDMAIEKIVGLLKVFEGPYELRVILSFGLQPLPPSQPGLPFSIS